MDCAGQPHLADAVGPPAGTSWPWDPRKHAWWQTSKWAHDRYYLSATGSMAVARWLGHSTTQMVHEHYAHLLNYQEWPRFSLLEQPSPPGRM